MTLGALDVLMGESVREWDSLVMGEQLEQHLGGARLTSCLHVLSLCLSSGGGHQVRQPVVGRAL